MRRTLKWTLPILAIVAICCAAILFAKRGVDESSIATLPDQSNGHSTEQNQDLAEAVADALRAASVTGRDFEIETQNGIVKLNGKIADAAQKALVTSVVSRLAGVGQVDNQLVLMGPDAAENRAGSPSESSTNGPSTTIGQSPTDLDHPTIGHRVTNQSVAQEVATQLSTAGLQGYDITVHYERGMLLLQGIVSHENDIELVAGRVAVVPGVFMVDNRVRHRSSAAPEEEAERLDQHLRPTPYFTLCFWPHGAGLPRL